MNWTFQFIFSVSYYLISVCGASHILLTFSTLVFFSVLNGSAYRKFHIEYIIIYHFNIIFSIVEPCNSENVYRFIWKLISYEI